VQGEAVHIRTALLLCVATSCTLAAQQSTTTYQSSITGSATTVTPPKYYVGEIDLSAPAGGKDKEKPAGCKASSPGSKLKSDLKLDEPYLLGEVPVVVHATAGDGCPVKLTSTGDVIKLTSSDADDGSAPAASSGSTYLMTFLKAGSATINAVEEPSTTGVKPPSTQWTVTVKESPSLCINGLLPQKPAKKDKTDLSSVVPYLGNPAPYSFQTAGEKVLVYSARELPDDTNKRAVARFTKEAQGLLAAVGNASGPAGAAATPASTPSSAAGGAAPSAATAPGPKPVYSIEVSVPHYASLGDLATRLNTANYSDFTIEDVGSSKVRITSKSIPACVELTAFLRDLRDLAWKPRAENPVDKLFFLNASDITGAFGSSGSAPGSSSPPSGSSGAQGGSSAAGGAPSSAGTGTTTAGTNPTTSSGGGSTPTSTGGSSGGPAGTTSPTGTPSPSSSSTGSAPGSTGGSGPSGTQTATSGATTPGAGTTSPPTVPTVSGIGADTLLFQEAVPGDDAAVTERKRLVALLDLPRPQMIINVWTLQTSSTKGEAVANTIGKLHQKVGDYNDHLQQAFQEGWKYLRGQISQRPDFFDANFYEYLTGKYVQDPPDHLPDDFPADLKPQETAQRILKRQTGTAMPDDLRKDRRVCPVNKYCLGYTNIFGPLKPRLTDLLLATIASSKPVDTMNEALNEMESTNPVSDPNCVQSDQQSERADPNGHFYMECFRAAGTIQFDASGQPSSLGLLRAALADFLFEYKLSQMYPHEFNDYQLSQSAQNLNTQLAPLVEAFNRDLEAFQSVFSEHVMNPKSRDESANWVGSERPTFVNNGLVSVRTISGFETTVSTTSQNFLDATQLPTASALAQSIVGAAPGSSSNPTGTESVLKNITPIQAQVILGALAAYQSSKVQIGRSLSIDVTPRSLSGASSAELTVKINADESASPTYYNPTASSSTSADLSRVANHDTSTRVRVDSIKLFDVSTFTAVLQKSRTRFPLLPPFVEIPYIGTVVGIPLPVAKEFHSSMAVLSTMIVPTAADIVLGLSFTVDQLVDSNGADSCNWPTGATKPAPPSCGLREATAFSDLKATAIRHYNSEMLSCFAGSGSCTVSLTDPLIPD
jgi:hypothetical protein